MLNERQEVFCRMLPAVLPLFVQMEQKRFSAGSNINIDLDNAMNFAEQITDKVLERFAAWGNTSAQARFLENPVDLT